MKSGLTATPPGLTVPKTDTSGARRHRLRGAVVALSLIGGGLGVAAPAEAATVLNRFERSCYWGCSPYRQTNGGYNAAFGSTCVTKGWSGTSSYYSPPRSPCR